MDKSISTGFVNVVDQFLAARKLLPGAARPLDWQRTHPDSAVMRVSLPIERDGEYHGQTIQVVCAVNSDVPKFDISLIFPPAVFQLHFDVRGGHTNVRSGERSGMPRRISGHHVHTWTHNRQFAQSARKLVPMHIAAPVPAQVADFDSALRWVCTETRIDIPDGPALVLPQREELI